MRQVGRLIKKRYVDPATLEADRGAFDAIVADMRANGGLYTPTPVWLAVDPRVPIGDDAESYLDEIASDAAFVAKFSRMDKMLDGWVGIGRLGIDREARERYEQFVPHCDPLQLWEANVEDETVSRNLAVADLGTIMDLNLIFSFAGGNPDGRTVMLDLGGGYGRLAEAALNVFGDSVFYVLVDSVPGSLYYAKSYLEAACPDRSIGTVYDGDTLDADRFDCFIVPSWQFEELNDGRLYDVVLNVESFQEMSQRHVDRYLRLFDDVTHEGSTVYVSNSHDYLFRGEWKYPSHWQKLFCANTPRSGTRNHPTEIFVKGSRDFSAANAAMNAAFEHSGGPMDIEARLANLGARATFGPYVRLVMRRAAERARRLLRISR